jgi:hypothetical protein
MDLNQKINTVEGYTNFVIALATKLQLFAYEVHAHIHEIGSETVPYFRLMWSTQHGSPMISMHVETASVVAIQFYTQAIALCPNLLLGESYYTSYSGETYVGTDAEIANQMDREASMTDTTTQTLIDEESEPVILIINNPLYHAEDPKSKETADGLKKRRGFGRFNG